MPFCRLGKLGSGYWVREFYHEGMVPSAKLLHQLDQALLPRNLTFSASFIEQGPKLAGGLPVDAVIVHSAAREGARLPYLEGLQAFRLTNVAATPGFSARTHNSDAPSARGLEARVPPLRNFGCCTLPSYAPVRDVHVASDIASCAWTSQK